jgi:hypothetical protein
MSRDCALKQILLYHIHVSSKEKISAQISGRLDISSVWILSFSQI